MELRSYMDSMQRMLLKHHAFLGGLFFILVVFYTHAPFFFYLPIPGISMDSFNYYWFAQEIFLNHLPLVILPHDFPYGYPLFLWFVKVIGGNIVTVTVLQTIVYSASGIWLIYHFSRAFEYGGIIAFLGLTLFTIQPFTINHNLRLLMESLYTSGLIFLAGSVVYFVLRRSVLSFYLVLIGVWWVMLIRPNGILMMTIPLILIFIAIVKGDRVRVFLPAVILLLTFNISGNYFFKGRAAFGDSKRMKGVVEKFSKRFNAGDPKAHIAYISNPNNEKTGSMIRRYFLNVIHPKPSFYYSILKTNYNKVITNNLTKDTSLRMMDGRYNIDTFSPNLKDFIFAGFQPQNLEPAKYAELTEYGSERKNKWMYSVHLFYELFNKSKSGYIIYLVFWLIIVWAIYDRFILKSSQQFSLHILILSWMHLLPLALLPFLHNRFQERYIHVSEFIIYIVFFMGIFHFLRQYLQRMPISQEMNLD